MQIKTLLRYYFSPIMLMKIKKYDNIWLVRMQTGAALPEGNLEISNKSTQGISLFQQSYFLEFY